MGKQKFAEKPWLTKGIQKSCKRKNALYKLFIKTKVAEQAYKLHKNKLTNIIRNSKREYYSKTLNYNRNNLAKTWKILNKIVRNNVGRTGSPTHFMTENSIIIRDKQQIANEFNDYFVNVGPSLAGEIVEIDRKSRPERETGSVNKQSMFIRGTYGN